MLMSAKGRHYGLTSVLNTRNGTGKAAVRVPEAAGVHVKIPDECGPSGRAAYSIGLLDLAQRRARTNVDVFSRYIADSWEIVTIEPSDAVVFQDEYHDLLPEEATDLVAQHTYGVVEYLDEHRLINHLKKNGMLTGTGEALAYHGHCHQKANGKD